MIPTFLLLMPDGLVVASLGVAEPEDDGWAGTLHPCNLPPELRAGLPWYEDAGKPTPRSFAATDAALARLKLRVYSQQTRKLYAIDALQVRGRGVRFRLRGLGSDPDGAVAAWSIVEGEAVQV
jgi:hypothetical protein